MAVNEKLYSKMQQEIFALASSVGEVVEKFKQLHHPLSESHERVPKATEQLDKISEQTEAAAHQMLDMVEGITQRESDIVAGLTELKTKLSAGTQDNAEAESTIDGLIEKADKNCNDAYTIMDVLQFQDITSQQMNHAAALLEDIEGRLDGIISIIHGKDSSNKEKKKSTSKRAERAYDPHADMYEKKTDQEMIDSIFSKK